MHFFQMIILLFSGVLVRGPHPEPSKDPKDHFTDVKKYYTPCPNFGETEDELKEFCNSEAFSNSLNSVQILNSFCRKCSGEIQDPDDFRSEICGTVLNIDLNGTLSDICTKNSARSGMYIQYYKCCKTKTAEIGTCTPPAYNPKQEEDCNSRSSSKSNEVYFKCVKDKQDGCSSITFLDNFLIYVTSTCNSSEKNCTTVPINGDKNNNTDNEDTTHENHDEKASSAGIMENSTSTTGIMENSTVCNTTDCNLATKFYAFNAVAINFIAIVLLRVL